MGYRRSSAALSRRARSACSSGIRAGPAASPRSPGECGEVMGLPKQGGFAVPFTIFSIARRILDDSGRLFSRRKAGVVFRTAVVALRGNGPQVVAVQARRGAA